MLNFLRKKLPVDLIEARAIEFIQIQAERHLKNTAAEICQGLTPDRIQKMVDADIRLADLMKETKYEIPKIDALARPGVNYLQSLSDERMLEILDEVVPEQVAILRRNPEFAHVMIEDLKALGGS